MDQAVYFRTLSIISAARSKPLNLFENAFRAVTFLLKRRPFSWIFWTAASNSFLFFTVIEQRKFCSFAAFPICSGCVGMQMLGFAYFMVSKHVMCPPLKITNIEFSIHS